MSIPQSFTEQIVASVNPADVEAIIEKVSRQEGTMHEAAETMIVSGVSMGADLAYYYMQTSFISMHQSYLALMVQLDAALAMQDLDTDPQTSVPLIEARKICAHNLKIATGIIVGRVYAEYTRLTGLPVGLFSGEVPYDSTSPQELSAIGLMIFHAEPKLAIAWAQLKNRPKGRKRGTLSLVRAKETEEAPDMACYCPSCLKREYVDTEEGVQDFAKLHGGVQGWLASMALDILTSAKDSIARLNGGTYTEHDTDFSTASDAAKDAINKAIGQPAPKG